MPRSTAFSMSYSVSAATDTATRASISTPVRATVPTRAVIVYPDRCGLSSTSTWVNGRGWQSGTISDVRFAAMIPASRAVWSGSPFLTARARIACRAAVLIRTSPRATASRAVSGFADTSTIRTRPRSSTCDSRVRLEPRDLGCRAIGLASREEEGQAFERDSEIDVLELHVWRDFEGARGEIENGANPGMYGGVHDPLRRVGRHGHDGDVDAVALDALPELVDVENADAALRSSSDLRPLRIEQRDDGKPFLTEPRVIRQRQAEVAGAEDGHAHRAIESQNHPQVALELFHVVADAADTELAQICQVLSNLGCVQLELFGQRLRAHGLHACRIERVQAAQID